MRVRQLRQSVSTRLQKVVTEWVRIDTRALAALRIALGTLLLIDLLGRSRNLVAFYTDSGVLPRGALAALAPTFREISIYVLWGSAFAQVSLFLVAGVGALALLVGYRTKLATLVSLVLLVSLQIRNPAVLNAGDSLLRHLLFWSLFLPLGERWAVDAVGYQTRRDSVASVATAGLLVQVVVVYATNAVFKFGGDSWLQGTAVEQVMLLTRHSTPIGRLFLEVPWLLTAANYVWLVLLVCSPLLLVLTGWYRAILPTLIGGIHAGMVVMMELGIFPLVSIAAMLPFLPTPVWNRLPEPPDTLFHSLATHRPSGFATSLSPTIRTRLASLITAVAAVALVGLLLINAISVSLVDLPSGAPNALENKAWDMFAPYPPSDDGWYVVPATLESGRQIDALRRANLTWDRPPDVSVTFQNRRWRKLLYQLRTPPETALQEPLAQYLCHRWNGHHENVITSLRLVYVEFPTREPGRGDQIELGQYQCSP